MKASVILSLLIILISCGELVKKSPEMSQARIDSIETMIADLDRELERFREHGVNESEPIIMNVTAVRDSLEALLP